MREAKGDGVNGDSEGYSFATYTRTRLCVSRCDDAWTRVYQERSTLAPKDPATRGRPRCALLRISSRRREISPVIFVSRESKGGFFHLGAEMRAFLLPLSTSTRTCDKTIHGQRKSITTARLGLETAFTKNAISSRESG
ncbi:unnamed protein product [Lasius platythorax]|uniref:Uncharacterized protein n=1 Tax=Lasius platythorax TaxID=488582 RepID=A0AAV2NJU8_9HYME